MFRNDRWSFPCAMYLADRWNHYRRSDFRVTVSNQAYRSPKQLLFYIWSALETVKAIEISVAYSFISQWLNMSYSRICNTKEIDYVSKEGRGWLGTIDVTNLTFFSTSTLSIVVINLLCHYYLDIDVLICHQSQTVLLYHYNNITVMDTSNTSSVRLHHSMRC